MEKSKDVATEELHALAVNRSLLAESERELKEAHQQLLEEPSRLLKKRLDSLQLKIAALKEDREKRIRDLSEEAQAYELMKDLLVQRAVLPRPQESKKTKAPETTLLHQKALELVAENDFARAAKTYEQIVVYDPNDDEAYLLMGHSYFLAGEYSKAESAYHNAVSINPENRREIVPFYENFILQNPSDDTAYANLGYAYLMLGEATKAKHAFQDALSIRPDNSSALAGLQKIEKTA